MVTKIDTDKLAEHIEALKNLNQSWQSTTYKSIDKDDNCGATVEALVSTNDSLDKMKTSFISLMKNTISYLEQRKDSIDSKENIATENVTK